MAIDFTSVAEAYYAWLQSYTHRKNILDPEFTETGVGYARGEFEGHPTLVIVQMFGKPVTPVDATLGRILGSQN